MNMFRGNFLNIFLPSERKNVFSESFYDNHATSELWLISTVSEIS